MSGDMSWMDGAAQGPKLASGVAKAVLATAYPPSHVTKTRHTDPCTSAVVVHLGEEAAPVCFHCLLLDNRLLLRDFSTAGLQSVHCTATLNQNPTSAHAIYLACYMCVRC